MHPHLLPAPEHQAKQHVTEPTAVYSMPSMIMDHSLGATLQQPTFDTAPLSSDGASSELNPGTPLNISPLTRWYSCNSVRNH